jgi:hypothetical protein
MSRLLFTAVLLAACAAPSSPLHARVGPPATEITPPAVAQPPGPLTNQPSLVQTPSYGGPITGGETPAGGANEGPSAGTSIPER